MGITPISNLIPLQNARALRADLEPLPMERVENSSRTGDETYSPSNGQSERGSKDGSSDEDVEEVLPDDPGEDSSPESASTARPISFFA